MKRTAQGRDTAHNQVIIYIINTEIIRNECSALNKAKGKVTYGPKGAVNIDSDIMATCGVCFMNSLQNFKTGKIISLYIVTPHTVDIKFFFRIR